MADILQSFVEEIKKAYGENLKSVILYGSRASGEETAKRSDYNLLVVLGRISFEDLRLSGRAVGRWIKDGNPPPLMFSDRMFRNSADVFPIEFLDMRDHHKVLHGDDPFVTLEIDDAHLRHECEFELKGKLLKLRQGYMAARGNAARLRALMMDSLSPLTVVARHTLRLLGVTPPVKKKEALQVIAEKTGADASIFAALYALRENDAAALREDPEVLMQRYLVAVEKIVDRIDALDREYQA